MSLGYAEKLSHRHATFLGKLGESERFEALEEVEAKVKELADLVRKSKHMVVYTGAGISTSCGIPDFRGPNGIWTLQADGKPIPQASCSFAQARPSYTHMALKALVDAGKVHYVVSQNVDGLHLRSGIPRRQLAELHGNCFREVCPKCGAEYVRDFELKTVGLKPTGRPCTVSGCNGRLRDSVLDWEDALPLDELRLSERHSKEADLALCLGTSLQIVPARNMPFKCIPGGGKIVIVNLQATPRDKKAALVVHAKADEVMQRLMQHLKMDIPPYVRVDRLVVANTLKQSPSGSESRWALSLRSSHGPKAPISLVKLAKATFQAAGRGPESLEGPKFILKGTERGDVTFEDVTIDVEFAEGTAARRASLEYRMHLNSEHEGQVQKGSSEAELRTAVEEASETGRAGAMLVMSTRRERSASSGVEWQTEYAIITDVVKYSVGSSAGFVADNAGSSGERVCGRASADGREGAEGLSRSTSACRNADVGTTGHGAGTKSKQTSTRQPGGRKRKHEPLAGV